MLVVATPEETSGEIGVSAVNRSLSEPVGVRWTCAWSPAWPSASTFYLSGDDPFPTNSAANSATEADRSVRGSAPLHFDLTPTMQLRRSPGPASTSAKGNSA